MQQIDFIEKQFSFDQHHATYKIFSDSLYYIISNLANKAGFATVGWNLPIILASNKIVFDNIYYVN